MCKKTQQLIILAGLAMALGSGLFAQELKLIPSGFGTYAYTHWRAFEGLADTPDTSNQALYFQKMMPTLDVGAGQAIIQGFEGQSSSALTGLQFKIRTGDGINCTLKSPRWSLRMQPLAGGPNFNQDIPCLTMVVVGTELDSKGRLWEIRSSIPLLLPGTIRAISILYDEGDDLTSGFAYLDDIRIQGTINGLIVDKTWRRRE